MIETTKEICKHCGKEYGDVHIVPRAPYAPYYCEKCMEELNTACDGSFMSAIYHASSHRSPMEEA